MLRSSKVFVGRFRCNAHPLVLSSGKAEVQTTPGTGQASMCVASESASMLRLGNGGACQAASNHDISSLVRRNSRYMQATLAPPADNAGLCFSRVSDLFVKTHFREIKGRLSPRRFPGQLSQHPRDRLLRFFCCHSTDCKAQLASVKVDWLCLKAWRFDVGQQSSVPACATNSSSLRALLA